MRKFAIAAILVILPLGLSAARLTLRNGDVLYGQFISGSPDAITFLDNTGRNQRYDLNQVQSIDFDTVSPSGGQSYNNDNQRSSNYNSNSAQDSNSGSRNYNDRNYNGNADRRNMADRSAGDWAVLPAGTQIAVRTDQDINTSTATEGRTYPASIAEDVVGPSGQVVIPRGSQADLLVRQVNEGGTLNSGNFILDLESVRVNGRRYMVSTGDVRQGDETGIGKNKRTAEMVGGGAVLGTLLGAVAGGGKGAAIGAIAGAAAGGGVQVLTKGKEIRVPAETVLTFRLDQPLHLKEMQ